MCPSLVQVSQVDTQTALCCVYSHDGTVKDEAGKPCFVTREPGKEEMRATVEKDDVGV